MARKFEMEAFIDSALRHVEADIRSSWPFIRKGDSPIEETFFVSLYLCLKLRPEIISGVAFVTDGRDLDELELADRIIVRPQHTLIDWPIDFVVECKSDMNDRTYLLAVECDGHDFHERTKEQAARDRQRDRALQEKNVAVFRFTGSELYRDPWKCAAQVVEWAEQARVRW